MLQKGEECIIRREEMLNVRWRVMEVFTAPPSLGEEVTREELSDC